MPIRKRISSRPKPERNHHKISTRGGKSAIVEFGTIGSTDTHVLYYDGERIGTFGSYDEAHAKLLEIKAAQ
jgi:hypothetical protein